MTFDLFRQHLGSVHRSAVTGRPLGRDAAGDYPSRLRRLQALLKMPLENAPPMVLRSLADGLRKDARVTARIPRGVIGDIGVALRAYAGFLEGYVPAGSGSGLDPQIVYRELLSLSFVSIRTPSGELVEMERGGIRIFVRLDSRDSIVVHPEFEACYSRLVSASGIDHPARLQFYNSPYMTLFPRRRIGRAEMHYGIQFALADRSAIVDFIGVLEDALAFDSPFGSDRTLKEETLQADTEQMALHKARIGQGRFRADLLDLWQGRCALTEVDMPELLRASHIKPWRSSNNSEKLNAFNGLLLAVHLDALFDRLLITFQDTGEMVVSKRISLRNRELFGMMPVRRKLLLSAAHLQFMKDHQERFAESEHRYA